MRDGSLQDNVSRAVPCRILVLPAAACEISAEAVRLDRQGGVFRLPEGGAAARLGCGEDVLVAFDLPGGESSKPRYLCFRASVRHVSQAPESTRWIGVSFTQAAICCDEGVEISHPACSPDPANRLSS